MTSSIAISGFECVQALCIAGFRVKQRLPGSTVLTRAGTGGQTIVVPDALVLPGPVLDALLGELNMSADHLMWLLGEVTTDTELMAL